MFGVATAPISKTHGSLGFSTTSISMTPAVPRPMTMFSIARECKKCSKHKNKLKNKN